MKKNHPFHLVTNSPWPILLSFSIMNFLISTIILLNQKIKWFMMFSFFILILNMYQWWRDVKRESSYKGDHTMIVKKMIKMGMIMFILSEIMFFISFFWSFFHSSLSPSIELGMKWPPKGINPFNPMEIPLLNTIILVSSGASITWAHNSLLSNKFKQSMSSMIITIILSFYFTTLQWIEYKNSSFTISDSVFGSTFFMTTGFHGIHVIVGTIFILTALESVVNMKSSKINHLSLELSAWYWHFVDVVWLFLYLIMYWWNK
uniref:Cytochrome c oxidase subunit 3 n=1 Tax=Epeurysa nawaii TaxID=1308479 RepID=A0A7S5DBP7_9HEMI|nr:cytochrome c oxidase subunit III [Epeurysa nawaii]QBZ37996.1 cytochrome c oxidase subunit III [Epeurysa nawaii]QBZ38009.1 cytochrome c oxidase subunit III [Epeurysa nawaii]